MSIRGLQRGIPPPHTQGPPGTSLRGAAFSPIAMRKVSLLRRDTQYSKRSLILDPDEGGKESKYYRRHLRQTRTGFRRFSTCLPYRQPPRARPRVVRPRPTYLVRCGRARVWPDSPSGCFPRAPSLKWLQCDCPHNLQILLKGGGRF